MPVESILVIPIVDAHDEENGSARLMLNLAAAAAPKRLKNISLHSHEAKLMAQLLSAFAAAVTDERVKQQEELDRQRKAKESAEAIISTHRAGMTNRGGPTGGDVSRAGLRSQRAGLRSNRGGAGMRSNRRAPVQKKPAPTASRRAPAEAPAAAAAAPAPADPPRSRQPTSPPEGWRSVVCDRLL